MIKECNLDHRCEGELFEAVEGGYVCEGAIYEECRSDCRQCGRYGTVNEMDYFVDDDEYECKIGYGCRDYEEERLEEMAEEYYSSLEDN